LTSTGKGRRTRQRILAAAADLMHERGLNAVTAGDVMRASETGKGQFYQHFDGREALVAEVFLAHSAFMKSFPPIDGWAALERWIDEHGKAQKALAFRRGCPLGTAAYALQPEQSGLRKIIADAFLAMQRSVSRFLRAERDAGRLSADAHPDRLAEFLVASVQGGLLLSLLHGNAAPFRSAAGGALAYLRSLVMPSAATR
jgi:AcrR family transcriptional regulator